MSQQAHFKIGLCGVPTSGKTVLARAVAREFNLPLIHTGRKERLELAGGAHRLPALPKMNEFQRMQWQMNFIQYRTNKETELAEFVADATALDMIVWYRMCSWLIPFDQKVPTEDLLYKLAKNYDYIFYLPFYPENVAQMTKEVIEKNPFFVDPFNLETADYVLKGVFTTMIHQGKKGYVLAKRSPESRLEEIREVILPQLPPSTIELQ